VNDQLSPDIKRFFEGRRLLIATKHEKEKILGPALEQLLGVQAFVLPDFDTDQFGTFAGEVERVDDTLTTLEKKIRAAMVAAGADLAVGSEGSFGPHPEIGWVAANQEWVMLLDTQNDFTIAAQAISTETNFAQQTVSGWAELLQFADRAGFPAHALILRVVTPQGTQLEKGIQDPGRLKAVFENAQKSGAVTTVETDMRAMFNPQRRQVISAALTRLIAKLASRCPQCGAPGFSVTAVRPGLPCSWCGEPTALTAVEISTCSKCSFTREVAIPNKADPQFCQHCNP
jgi:hypothetical protein